MHPKDPIKYEEWRRKQSESHKGQVSGFKGKKHTSEALLKQKLIKLGNTYRVGKSQSVESNLKNREAHLGKQTWMKGKKHSVESNFLNSKAHLGNTYRVGKKHKPESILKIKQARAKQIMPIKDTKIERIIQIALTLNNIKFQKHRIIQSNDFFHQVDIFIEPDLCIEIDGEHWHTLPHMIDRDKEVNEKLPLLGFRICRFWGNDVIKDAQILVENIKNLI